MVCIYCDAKTKTINSRLKKRSYSTWRRVSCPNCKAVMTTEENVDLSLAIRVQKKNGSLEPFSRDKLYLSIHHSLDHINTSKVLTSALVSTVINNILKDIKTPLVTTNTISEYTGRVISRFNAAGAIKYFSLQRQLQLPRDIKKTLL